jgi:imidazolonepropionase-like amidohydrolase
MRLFIFLLCAFTITLIPACHSNSNEKPPSPITLEDVVAYEGAYVFDGEAFSARTICVLDSTIIDCPETAGRTVSLAGQFVTPPFGDAHTHHFDGPFTLDWHTSIGFETGAFYAANMTAMTSEVTRIREQISGPGNIDVSSSLGGVTGPNSHPAEVYEALSLGMRSYEQQIENQDAIRASQRVADNAYFVVETPEDVEAKMSLLLSQNPDHVKVYLRQSERYAEGWGKWGPGGGVDPNLVPQIAEITKAAGKNLAIATSSVHDFRVALESAADNATHAPCYQETDGDPTSPYYDVPRAEDCVLSEQDAERAAQIGMTTTFIVTEWEKQRPQKYLEWERQNIDTLYRNGATIVIGSNSYGAGITDGLIAGAHKGIFSARDLLKIASMDTPKMIFPDRAVGCMDPGCEASFIAFSSNPLERFEVIKDITFRLKDGERVTL